MKILFCTDGSKISFNAIKNYSHWYKTGTIDAISVADWSFLPEDLDIQTEKFTSCCTNLASEILERTESEIKKLGIQFGKKIKSCGNIVEGILEQTEKKKYDLILLGSHGKKGIQKWLGSVSREIAYNNNLSTYITREENDKKRILFTTDNSESANYAITKSLENLNLENKEIFLCTVTEYPDLLFLDGNIDTNWLLSIEKQQEKYAIKTLTHLEKIFSKKGLEIKQSINLNGNPAQKIIDYASSNKIDLIVMGSKCKSKMQNFLLGSVSKKVLENTLSDVLIYKDI